MDDNSIYRKLWGKTSDFLRQIPGTSAIGHMLNAAAVGYVLLPRYRNTLRSLGIDPRFLLFLCFIHDIGKISWGFQAQIPAWNEWYQQAFGESPGIPPSKGDFQRTGHTLFTQYLLWDFLEGKGASFELAGKISAIIGAHHGFYAANHIDGPGKIPSRAKRIDWKRLQQDVMNKAFGRSRLPENLSDEAIQILGGIVAVCDWISSGSHFPRDRDVTWKESLRLAQEATKAYGMNPLSVIPDLDFREIFMDKEGSPYEPREFQKLVYSEISKPGIILIEAPMGLGKTEIAFMIAYNLIQQGYHNGIYFGLPTQITSDKAHETLLRFIKNVSPKAITSLVHGGSWLCDNIVETSGFTEKDAEECGEALLGKWFGSPLNAIFASAGAGTIDQVLLSSVCVSHYFARLASMSGKVVILDEVHSYETYTSEIILETCRRLANTGCTVILLSATLPDAFKKALFKTESLNQSYPICSYRPYEDNLLRYIEGPSAGFPIDKKVSVRFVDKQDALEQVVNLARQGAYVLWVCDTVKEAQDTYAEISSIFPATGLLTSRTVKHMRNAMESQWLHIMSKERPVPGGKILVGTQVIEQSLNIDADLVVSELAPIDSLLQRVGRGWRFPIRDRAMEKPELWILEDSIGENQTDLTKIRKAFGAKAYVYHPYILLKTRTVLMDVDSIDLPKDIRHLLACVYGEGEVLDDLSEVLMEDYEGRIYAHKTIARISKNLWQNTMRDNGKTGTRLSTRPSGIVVLAQNVNAKTVTLSNGDVIPLSSFSDSERLKRYKKSLFRNAGEVPLGDLNGLRHEETSKLFHESAIVAYPTETNELVTIDGNYTNLFWDKIIGFYKKNLD